MRKALGCVERPFRIVLYGSDECLYGSDECLSPSDPPAKGLHSFRHCSSPSFGVGLGGIFSREASRLQLLEKITPTPGFDIRFLRQTAFSWIFTYFFSFLSHGTSTTSFSSYGIFSSQFVKKGGELLPSFFQRRREKREKRETNGRPHSLEQLY